MGIKKPGTRLTAFISGGMYSWSAEDMKILQNTAFILAADSKN